LLLPLLILLSPLAFLSTIVCILFLICSSRIKNREKKIRRCGGKKTESGKKWVRSPKNFIWITTRDSRVKDKLYNRRDSTRTDSTTTYKKKNYGTKFTTFKPKSQRPKITGEIQPIQHERFNIQLSKKNTTAH
jgi:hypothetical protein